MSIKHLSAFADPLIPTLSSLACTVALVQLRAHKTRCGIQTLLVTALAAGTPAAFAALDAVVQTRLDAGLRCLLGVYTLPGQRTVIITGAHGQPRGLHYTLEDGQFGDLKETADGSWARGPLVIRFGPCSAGTLRLAQGKAIEARQRLGLVEQTTTFMSDALPLFGKLVLPPGGHARALAVWVEGSSHNPSTDDAVWPYQLARRGLAVFVNDKRGTGASGGEPTADFHGRARDTAAAVREAQRVAPGITRMGVIGASQGAWVAPLVATPLRLDFIVAASALAEGPIAQDQALVAQQLREAGFDAQVLAHARELTTITENIVRSDMQSGLSELEAIKTRFAGAAWLAAIQPRSYTGLFLKFSTPDIKTHGPAMAQGLSFDHEPRPVIEAIQARQLWLLGGSDRQAPNAGTQAILRHLQQKRRDIAVAVFPQADDGLIEPASSDPGGNNGLFRAPVRPGRPLDPGQHTPGTRAMGHHARCPLKRFLPLRACHICR